MTNKFKLKDSFDVESKHGAFYTGGQIEWHDDKLFCQTEYGVSILNITNGLVSKHIGEEQNEDADVIHTFVSDNERIITSHKSGLLKQWNLNGELVKMWKSIHKGPIAKLQLKESCLASGGSDGIIRIWNLEHQACELSLKECSGVINVVEFHSVQNSIFGSGDDGKIFSWNLEDGKLQFTYEAHYSKVTSLIFAHDNKHFVSCGRDKVIILWEFNTKIAVRTVPTYEAIEVITALPLKFKIPGHKSDPDNIYVASGGENGIVKVWNLTKSVEIYSQTNSLVSKAEDEGGLAITHLIYEKEMKAIAVVTAEHNIIIHHLKSFSCLKQFVGFSDEILDITFLGDNDGYLAVATNSKDIKLYDNTNMNCQIIKGHEDIVLSLDSNKFNRNLMLSSSKDNSIRLWHFDGIAVKCIGVGNRHTASVGSVKFSQLSANFAVSVSQDTCVKVWNLPNEELRLDCTYTEIAHQKEINCVTVSPNDKMIATASQDKTAKLWTNSLNLVGVLRGHKRGVWSIRFSPVDQVVLTSSADCTIKLWSVTDLGCLKTFEGHEASVLRAEFVSNGLQVLSAGADGLLKLFCLKTSQCITTTDEHSGRIWALAIKTDESRFITGGSDSFLIKWKDVTEERKLERQKMEEEIALQEQLLSNYIHNDQLLKALKLALRLDKPLQVLRIIQGVLKKGDTRLADTIKELRNDQKESLFKCAFTWNMNSKNCQPAQLVMNILINELQTGDFRPVGLNSMIESGISYTERHFKRLTQLMQDLYFLNYTVNCMQPHAKNV